MSWCLSPHKWWSTNGRNQTFKTPGIALCTNLVSGQLPGDGQEYFINVVCVLRWRLHEKKSIFLGISGRLFVLYHSFLTKVTLVTSESDDDVGPRLKWCIRKSVFVLLINVKYWEDILQNKIEYLSLQFFDPVLGPCKGVRVSDVVNHDGSLRTTVVHRRQRMVSFL